MIQKFKEWLFVAFFLGIIIVLLLGFYLNFQEKRQTKKAEADFYMGCLLAVQKNTTFQNHNYLETTTTHPYRKNFLWMNFQQRSQGENSNAKISYTSNYKLMTFI